ncbi:MAG: delta-aminolevulinic acid dehydratase [Bacteroidota bacterium]
MSTTSSNGSLQKSIGILVGPDVGLEPHAIRNVVEGMGHRSVLFPIGRPNELLRLLQGEEKMLSSLDHLILSVHGKDGKIVMPKLAASVYEKGEPRKNLGHEDLRGNIKLSGQTVINLGCGLGHEKMAWVFQDGGAGAYLAPKSSIEGNAILMFITRFYYELAQSDCNVKKAHELARAVDVETWRFGHWAT